MEAAKVERERFLRTDKQRGVGDDAKVRAAPKFDSPAVVPATDILPEHHEAHVGPYGVEMPPNFSFVVTVIEVSVSESGAAASGTDEKKPEG